MQRKARRQQAPNDTLTVRIKSSLLCLGRHGRRQRLKERGYVLASALPLEAAVQHRVVALGLDEVLALQLGSDGQLHAHELHAVLSLLALLENVDVLDRHCKLQLLLPAHRKRESTLELATSEPLPCLSLHDQGLALRLHVHVHGSGAQLVLLGDARLDVRLQESLRAWVDAVERRDLHV